MPGIWHFYTEPVKTAEAGAVIPSGSLLARWQAAEKPSEKQTLAEAVQKLLINGPPVGADEKSPDVALYRQLASLGGPLFMRAWPRVAAEHRSSSHSAAKREGNFGIDPALFGKRPDGSAIDEASLCVQAPSVIEIRLPADLVDGTEFLTVGALDPKLGNEGSVQLQVLTGRPKQEAGLLPISVTDTRVSGPWTSNKHNLVRNVADRRQRRQCRSPPHRIVL